MTGADRAGTARDESYNYDANGNRTNADYSTGTDNRLQSDGVYTYTYDNEGNLKTRTRISTGEVRKFSWDYRNRLTSVADNGSITATYTYDAMDRRISKSVPGTTTRFVYDRDNVLLEFMGSAIPSVRYLHGTTVDQVLAQEKDGQTSWMLTDQLGSVRDLVSNAGTVVGHFTYDSFGQVVSATGTVDTRYKFTGRELDSETGLYYYRARYYDARVGRFIGQDPIQFQAGDANLYRYVGNNSLNATDPSGLLTIVIPGGFNNYGNIINNIRSLPARYPVITTTVGNARPENLGGALGARQDRNWILIRTSIKAALNAGLRPSEPINIIAHSDGNRDVDNVVGYIRNLGNITLIANGFDRRTVGCVDSQRVKINVARLDPSPLRKPFGADRVIDVGSNVAKPKFGTPEWLANQKGDYDFRARSGVTHNGLLNEKSIIQSLKNAYGFEF